MEKYIDLHTHSIFSDGTLSPEEIIKLANERNLYAVALTDHDTVEGLYEFVKAGLKYDVKTIPGIELSCEYNNTEIHIVGLNIDYNNPDLLDFLNQCNLDRQNRNIKMIEKLNEHGFDITLEQLKEVSGGKVITRAHYAKLMEVKKYVSNKNEAFDKYLGDGKPCYVRKSFFNAADCIKIIKKANGHAVLAHPTLYGLNYRQINSMCIELIKYGLEGIEVMYSTYRHEQEREITRISKNLNLNPSGGSDFHGDNKQGIFLGVGKGNLRIPADFLNWIV